MGATMHRRERARTETAWLAAAGALLVACGAPDRPPLEGVPEGANGAADPTGAADAGVVPGSSFDGAAAPADSGAGVVDDPSPVWSARQGNPARTGAIDDPLLGGPLVRTWDVSAGSVSYPLIARGLVYVFVDGGRLEALSLRTGAKVWGPIDLGLGGHDFAYEDGRVFASDTVGLLHAFDSATGAVLWTSQAPGPPQLASPSAAYRGIVYGVATGYEIYAVDELTGGLLWTTLVSTNVRMPAVSADGVFVSGICQNVNAFDRTSGAPVWYRQGTCDGSGANMPALFGGRAYIRDTAGGVGPFVYNATTGAVEGTFTADLPPASHAGLGFFVSQGILRAESLATRAHAWAASAPGAIVTPPVVVSGRVYVGAANGALCAIDEATGAQVWSDDLSADGAWSGGSAASFAAAEGTLVVPTGGRLVAYAAP